MTYLAAEVSNTQIFWLAWPKVFVVKISFIHPFYFWGSLSGGSDQSYPSVLQPSLIPFLNTLICILNGDSVIDTHRFYYRYLHIEDLYKKSGANTILKFSNGHLFKEIEYVWAYPG